jgi:hypothetical protein
MTVHLHPAMQKICRNEGITIKTSGSRVIVLYEKDEAKLGINDDVKVSFGISFDDADFFNFTQPGLNQIGRVLVCGNGPGIISPTGSESLHDGEYVDEKCVMPANEQDPDAITPGISLLVELNLKALIAQMHTDTSSVSGPMMRYVIRFAAREAPWLYWFWLNQGKLNKLIVAESDFDKLDMQLHEESADSSDVDFEKLDSVVSLNNRKGVRFLSSAPVKLGACSDFRLSLTYQSEMGSKTLIDQIPHPAKDCLEMLAVGNKEQIVASSHVSL